MAIKVTSVACGGLGALSLYALVEDPLADMRPVDNVLLYGPAVLALAFALAGFSLDGRPRLRRTSPHSFSRVYRALVDHGRLVRGVAQPLARTYRPRAGQGYDR